MSSCAEFDQIHAPKSSLPAFLTRMMQLFWIHQRRRVALKELQCLDDRALRDIGVKRHDIAAAVDREVGRLALDEFRSRL